MHLWQFLQLLFLSLNMVFVFISFLSETSHYFALEELLGSLGGDRVDFVIQTDADAVLAVAHTECGVEVHLFAQIVLCNKSFKGLRNLFGAFEVAGTADTNSKSHNYPILSYMPAGKDVLYVVSNQKSYIYQ